jgi:uncharacterized membrane protein
VPDSRALCIAAFAAASALCVATLELRIQRTGDPYYRFLVWNLFLAWVPLGFAVAAFGRARRLARNWRSVTLLLVLWLLFFPNAPYMLTDFIHLGGEDVTAPVWYDALMLSSFAWTALLLGFASLYLVQIVIRRAAGTAASWAAVVVALGLASYGVYLGRFVRLNSWDALLRPRRVLEVTREQIDNPLQHPRIVGVLLTLTLSLLVAYAVIYTFAGLRLQLEHRPDDVPDE